MVSLIVVTLLSAGIGLIAWAVNIKNKQYGVMIPIALAIVAGVLTWVLCIAGETGYLTGLTWIPWTAPLLVAGIAAFATLPLLTKNRRAYDVAQLTTILKR